MQLASVLNRRSAYPLVVEKNASVAVNGGNRRREGQRWQASDKSRLGLRRLVQIGRNAHGAINAP
jgi:hypothetical protein